MLSNPALLLYCIIVYEQTSPTLCYYGKDPETPAVPTGISDITLNAMKENLQLIPSLKWQYFGDERGTNYIYPGLSGCDHHAFDPRFRYGHLT